jgi:hypothetical protein
MPSRHLAKGMESLWNSKTPLNQKNCIFYEWLGNDWLILARSRAPNSNIDKSVDNHITYVPHILLFNRKLFVELLQEFSKSIVKLTEKCDERRKETTRELYEELARRKSNM